MASRTVKFDTSDLLLMAEMAEMYLNEHDNFPVINKQAQGIVRKCKNNAKTIKISSRKGKGRGLQQTIGKDIAELVGCYYDQSDDSALVASRPMGQAGLDIILRGNALIEFPFSVECKCSEGLNLTDTYEQVQANVIPGTDWLIVHKRKSIPEIIVMLSWDVFKKILKERK
jgi:hypothetical protein